MNRQGGFIFLSLLLSFAAEAQPYPSRPVRIIVPFGTGAPDTVARLIGPQLSNRLGRPFVVENRPGANGVIGTEAVAKSSAAGHTLLIVSASIVINPSIYRKLPYDVLGDLTPITGICSTEAYILGVNPELPARNVQELIALARRPDSRIAFGSPGIGNTLHLVGELFNARAGIQAVHVPYKGAGPAITALLANEVQMMFLTPPLSLAHIKAGKIRAIGYTHKKRASFLPEVPTLSEAGVQNMEIDGGWYALFGPGNLPPEVVAKLHAEVRRALADQAVSERLGALGLDPVGSAPADFGAQVRSQIRAYAEMVRLAGIQPE